MKLITLSNLKSVLFIAFLVTGTMMTSAGIAVASSLHVIDEDDAYITGVSGSFTEDTTCGARGDCEYVMNDTGPSFSNAKTWNFWNMYCVVDGACSNHAWNDSNAFIFIPSGHGTTRNAKYTSSYNVYDPVLCPNLCTTSSSAFVNQYSYSDAWVPIHATTATKQFNSTTLNNATGETDNWYVVAWEAAKVEY